MYRENYNLIMLSLYELPPEILHHILSYIDETNSLKMLSLTSKSMYNIVNKKLWKTLRLQNPAGLEVIANLPVQNLFINFLAPTGKWEAL